LNLDSAVKFNTAARLTRPNPTSHSRMISAKAGRIGHERTQGAQGIDGRMAGWGNRAAHLAMKRFLA
jgi:hypothetical protein